MHHQKNQYKAYKVYDHKVTKKTKINLMGCFGSHNMLTVLSTVVDRCGLVSVYLLYLILSCCYSRPSTIDNVQLQLQDKRPADGVILFKTTDTCQIVEMHRDPLENNLILSIFTHLYFMTQNLQLTETSLFYYVDCKCSCRFAGLHALFAVHLHRPPLTRCADYSECSRLNFRQQFSTVACHCS